MSCGKYKFKYKQLKVKIKGSKNFDNAKKFKGKLNLKLSKNIKK